MKRLLLALLTLLVPLASTAQGKVLTMEEAVQIALKQNPTLEAAKLTFSMAREAEREAWTRYFPTLKFNYNYTRWNEEQHVRLQAVEIPPLFPGMQPVTLKPGNVITSRQNVYEYYFTLQQPIFTGWAITAAHRMAILTARQAELEAQETRLEVAYNVKKAYLGILIAKRMEEVAELAVKQLSQHLFVAKNFFEKEMIPRNDLLKSQVALAQAKQDLVRARNNVSVAKATLNAILHRDVTHPIRVKDMDLLPRPSFSLKEAIQKALDQRPIVEAARKGVEKGKEGIRLARSDYFPHIMVEGVYRKHGNHPNCNGDDLTDAEDWRLTAGLEWSLFEMGRTRHQVEKARLGELKALAQLKEVEDKVALEVQDAYLAMKAAFTNIDTARKAVDQAKENFRVTEERYKEQIDTSTEVLDAQTLLTQAQTYYYRALYQYNLAVARLLRVMGEEP